MQLPELLLRGWSHSAGQFRPGPLRRGPRRGAAGVSDAIPFGSAPDAEPEHVPVLPRLREKDPFKVLGIPVDSDFEEVQQARNYLFAEYREHEASREHIELAYEQIVAQSFRDRRKKGFRPSRGKRGERVRYEVPPGWLGRLRGLVDPSVTVASAARDLVMFCAVALWSSLVIPANAAAVAIGFGYAVFRTTSKRKIRNPDGPYFADSPVYGALLLNVIGMLVTMVVAGELARVVPFWSWNINPERADAFLRLALLCPFNIFLK